MNEETTVKEVSKVLDDLKGNYFYFPPCFHPNAVTKCIGGVVTVEELVDYCPDCGAEWNHRIEC